MIIRYCTVAGPEKYTGQLIFENLGTWFVVTVTRKKHVPGAIYGGHNLL